MSLGNIYSLTSDDKSPLSSTYFTEIGRKKLKQFKSQKCQADHSGPQRLNSHVNNSDSRQSQSNTQSLKEFEKKLINLPTFAISTEYASNSLMPIASSNALDANNLNKLSVPSNADSPNDAKIIFESKLGVFGPLAFFLPYECSDQSRITRFSWVQMSECAL